MLRNLYFHFMFLFSSGQKNTKSAGARGRGRGRGSVRGRGRGGNNEAVRVFTPGSYPMQVLVWCLGAQVEVLLTRTSCLHQCCSYLVWLFSCVMLESY